MTGTGSTLSGQYRSTTRLGVRPLLVATAIVTYLVMVAGVVLATTDGQPVTHVLHHALAFGGGVLVLSCFVVVLVDNDRSRGVVVPVGCAVSLYLPQAVIGWQLYGGAGSFGTVHVILGMAVFACIMYALVRQLDLEHPTTDHPVVAGKWNPGVPTSRSEPPRGSSLPRVRAYLALTKPRLMWLLSLLAVAGIGLAVGAGATVDGVTVVATIGGGVLAVGASGTFNHVYERDRDRLMARTADRPVATAGVSAGRATVFGLFLAVAGIGTIWLWTTPLAAVLTAIAMTYYAVVYTVMLKPSTTWNIAIGGGAGALPAVIGWAAVTGSIGLPAVVLALIVMLWTPAHFYNLAILYYRDYDRGGYPMLPIEKGIRVTRRRIGYSLGSTLIATTGLGHLTGRSTVFALAAGIGGIVFLTAFIAQYERRTPRHTRRTFVASNAFLGVVLAAIILETLLG